MLKPSDVVRVRAFTTGLVASGLAYLATDRLIWDGAARITREYGFVEKAEEMEPLQLAGPKTQAYIVQKWNGFVDCTLGSFAKYLASKGL